MKSKYRLYKSKENLLRLYNSDLGSVDEIDSLMRNLSIDKETEVNNAFGYYLIPSNFREILLDDAKANLRQFMDLSLRDASIYFALKVREMRKNDLGIDDITLSEEADQYFGKRIRSLIKQVLMRDSTFRSEIMRNYNKQQDAITTELKFDKLKL
tara:strand:- start:3 stop:467 length:465 start_codon:yes stop_codon:yes gene_type:complete